GTPMSGKGTPMSGKGTPSPNKGAPLPSKESPVFGKGAPILSKGAGMTTVSKSTGSVCKSTGSVSKSTGTVSKSTGAISKATGSMSKATGSMSKATGAVNRAAGAMTKLSLADGSRLKGVQIVKPIIYGNVAWYLGSKRDNDGHTHQWKVYLKAYNNEDLSVYIKRVHFKLHDSYKEPNRICFFPPFGVTETGWGEFEITMKIFFQDSNERPVVIYHFLKLFDREKDGNVRVMSAPVHSEFYDEMIFTDPTAKMYRLLTHPRVNPHGSPSHRINYENKKVTDLQKIIDAKHKVRKEIAELKDRLSTAKDSIQLLKSQGNMM
ncbi:YEATS domain-containing protein 4, partial [Trichonephila inaurata madagascariensis]